MAILAVCSGCNVRLTLGDDRAGDRFECPQCDAMIKVPGGVPTAPASVSHPQPREADAEPAARPDVRVIGGIVAGHRRFAGRGRVCGGRSPGGSRRKTATVEPPPPAVTPPVATRVAKPPAPVPAPAPAEAGRRRGTAARRVRSRSIPATGATNNSRRSSSAVRGRGDGSASSPTRRRAWAGQRSPTCGSNF